MTIVKLIAIAFLLINCSGCLLLAGAAGGAGTAVWLSGKLETMVDASMEKASEATQEALKSLEYTISTLSVKTEVIQIRGNHPDGRQFWIDILPMTPKSSKIEVRVGVKGDETESGKIIDAIGRRI